MIADSPYRFRDSVMAPGIGAATGAGGAALMMGMLRTLEPVSALELAGILYPIGSASLAACPVICGGVSPTAVGLVMFVLVGAVLGLLYAASQQRATTRGLVAVGVFYGVLLWVIGGLVIGPILGSSVKGAIRSWPWLLASVLYGLSLAATAIWVEAHRPAGPSDAVAD